MKFLSEFTMALSLKALAKHLLSYLYIVVTRNNVHVPLVGGDGIELLYHDRYEPWMRALFREANKHRAQERITLIDIGANIGQTLTSAKLSINNLLYIGIEPNPRCLTYLLRLRDLNNWTNCSFISAPCANSQDLVSLYFDPTNTSPGGSLVSDLRPDNCSAIHSVPVSFEQIAKHFSLTNDDFIILKIDVEGLEYDILSSISPALLCSLRPLIVIEVLPHVLQHQHLKIVEWCLRNSYVINKINTTISDVFSSMRVSAFSKLSYFDASESNYILFHPDGPFPLHHP